MQLKLLSLLLVAFFCGGVGGMRCFRTWAVDALLVPAACEAALGFGYLVYRTVLRPRCKARRAGGQTSPMKSAPAADAAADAAAEPNSGCKLMTSGGEPEHTGRRPMPADDEQRSPFHHGDAHADTKAIVGGKTQPHVGSCSYDSVMTPFELEEADDKHI